MRLDKKDIDELRDVVRLSIGAHADTFTDEDLADFGMSLLEATAIILKAKYNLKRPTT
jgi:hypothetical protein